MISINTKYYTAQLTFDEDLPHIAERMDYTGASPEAWSLLGEILGLLKGVTIRIEELKLKLQQRSTRMNKVEALDCLDETVRRINKLMEFIDDYDADALTDIERDIIEDTVVGIKEAVFIRAKALENSLREGDGSY